MWKGREHRIKMVRSHWTDCWGHKRHYSFSSFSFSSLVVGAQPMSLKMMNSIVITTFAFPNFIIVICDYQYFTILDLNPHYPHCPQTNFLSSILFFKIKITLNFPQKMTTSLLLNHLTLKRRIIENQLCSKVIFVQRPSHLFTLWFIRAPKSIWSHF